MSDLPSSGRNEAAAPNFDRVARLYRWAEYLALGPLLQRTRMHFMTQLADRRSALVLGDGDGRFLAELLRGNPALKALSVDTSERMLDLLRTRCAFAEDRLTTLQTLALRIVPDRETDLIVSHFFLDCLHQDEVDALARIVAKQCRRGTRWLVSDFQVPAAGWKKHAGAWYIRFLYFAFRLLTGLQVRHLPDVRGPLRAAGFVRISYHETLGGLLYSELWQLEQPVE